MLLFAVCLQSFVIDSLVFSLFSFNHHNPIEVIRTFFSYSLGNAFRVIRGATVYLFSPTGLAVLGCSVGLEIPPYRQRDQSYKTGGSSGGDIGSQGAGPQRAIGSTMVPNPFTSLHESLSSMEGTNIPPMEKGPEFSNRGIGRPGIQSQWARPGGTKSFTKQAQETNEG